MAGIPQNFQSFSNVLANYDFVDIAAGTGFINFYAGNTVDIKLLSNYTYYSEEVYTSSASYNDADYTKVLDLDFDCVLNRPLDICGKTVVNVPIAINRTSGTVYGYVTVRVRKYSGTTETEVATNDSSALANASGTAYDMKTVDVDIPLTHYKIGDTLRLTIEGWGKQTGSGAGYLYIANDPMNRSTTWDTTAAVPSKLEFQCPVRLNL